MSLQMHHYNDILNMKYNIYHNDMICDTCFGDCIVFIQVIDMRYLVYTRDCEGDVWLLLFR